MIKINQLLLCIIMVFTFTIEAQKVSKNHALEDEIPKDTTATRGELKNGLKYYIKSNNKPKDVVYIRLVVKAGMMQEDKSQMGLAHLLEHMGFNGTKNFKKNKLVTYLESIGMTFGADINAHTGLEETVYKLQIPSKNKENLDTAFQIIEDWAHDMTLDDQAIDDERPVVVEEFRARSGKRQRINKSTSRFLYQGMPQLKYYSDDKIDNIKNFTPNHMRRFYTDWYRPNLMGVVVVGDIDVNYAQQRIEKHFSKLKNPENPKAIITHDTVPYHANTRVKIITDPEQTSTYVNLHILDKFPELEKSTTIKSEKKRIITSIMSRVVNNRLKELSNSNNPPFIHAGVGVVKTISSRHSQFYASVVTSETEIKKGLKQLILELERIKRFGITAIELERVKKSMLASNEAFLEQKDNWDSKKYLQLLEQEFKAQYVLYNKDWNYNFNKKTIQETTAKDVETMFAKYYRKDNRAIVFSTAKKDNVTLLTKQEFLETVAQAESSDAITAYTSKQIDANLIKNLNAKGSIVSQENLLHNIKKLVLSNGVEVYYKKTDFKKKAVSFSSFSYGGTSLQSNKEAVTIAPIMGITTTTGIGDYTPEELSKILSGKKVSVKPSVSTYKEGVSGFARAKDLETMFKLIYLNFTSRNKDEAKYLARVNKIKASIKNRALTPENAFAIAISDALNSGNPRYINTRKNDNLERLLDSVPYLKLHEYYSERFKNAGDFKFFFVGDFNEEVLKTHITTYLSSLPSTKERENFKLSSYKNILKNEKITVYAGLEDKATLLIRFNKEAKHMPKEEKALKIFGEIFKSRLRNRIREDQGGVYALNAQLKHVSKPYSKYTARITFNCSPKNIDMLEQETLKVLKTFLKEGPTKKEVESIKKSWILNREKGLETNNFWKNYMYNTIYKKKTFKPLNNFKSSLKAITPKYIKKIANKYVEQPSFTAKLLPKKEN